MSWTKALGCVLLAAPFIVILTLAAINDMRATIYATISTIGVVSIVGAGAILLAMP